MNRAFLIGFALQALILLGSGVDERSAAVPAPPGSTATEVKASRETTQVGTTTADVAADAASNQPPDAPLLDSPPNNATGVSISPTLDVTVSDPGGDPLSVAYSGRSLGGPVHPPFSLVIIPDTQHYTAEVSGGTLATFIAQTQWIVDNMQSLNTVFVAHTGDCTDHGDTYPVEWDRTWSAMNLLEDAGATGLPYGLPYAVAVGNHDMTPINDPSGTTISYNEHFGFAHFEGRPYYGGHFGSNNNNHFSLFSASGIDFIVVSMQYDSSPDADVLAWADGLLTAFPSRWAIVSVHDLIGTGNPAAFSSQGQAIYNALKDNPNLFLMVCGHVHGEGRRSDTYNGRTVHTVMADYQERLNGGDGWLRIMTICPDENVIRVKTYSPTLDLYETDADSSSQFTLSIGLTSADEWQPVGTVMDVPSGSHCTLPWPGRDAITTYEWYVTVSNGKKSTTGPTWRFTTESESPTARVVHPAGGEALTVGQGALLEWMANDDVGVTAADLLLSRTGVDGAYETIATGLENSGSYEWTVVGPETGNAFLKVIAYDADGHAGVDVSDSAFSISVPTGIRGSGVTGFAIDVLSSNPVSTTGRFSIAVPRETRVRVAIYDALGREVDVLTDGVYSPGRHALTWDVRTARGRVPSGVYFVTMETAGVQLTRKIVLVR